MPKTKLGPSETLFPLPTALVACGDEKRKNIITVAWIAPIDNSPPLLMFSLAPSRHSLGMIREFKAFTVNLAPVSLVNTADHCGIVSGRDVEKFEGAGLTATFCETTGAPLINECPFGLECKLFKEFEISDRVIIVGEVVETYADSDKLIDNSRPDIAKMDVLAYCTKVREYWSLDAKKGEAFSCGKDIG